jgi:hypothetical protein
MPINSFLYPGAKVTTGYDVANSLRLNDGSSSYLHKTPSSGGNRRTFTFSTWFKRGTGFGNEQALFTGGNDANASGFFTIYFTTNDRIDAHFWNGSSFDSVTPNGVLRDSSAWTHIVVAVDTTQATDSNRIKWYINGTEQTSLYSTDYPTQNHEFNVNHTTIMQVGVRRNGSGALIGHYDGYLAETVLIDGTQLDQTSFGEFDSDTPNVWKPKDVSGLTFGTNGFYLDYEDSGNLGNDVNGGTDLTQVNLSATNQSTDTCTNNFATFNNLLGSNRQGSQLTFSEGNCKVQDSGGSNDPYIPSTIGVTKGKWYAELKLDAYTEDGHAFGIAATDGDFSESTANLFCILQYATKAGDNLPRIYNFGDVSVDDQADNNPGDIIGCAVDIDNGTVDFTVNGSAYASQVTGLSSNFSGKTIFFIIRGEGGGSRTFTSSVNFGSPSFSISSGNSDANGHGNFEYSVPSGYFALCTKNLAEFG